MKTTALMLATSFVLTCVGTATAGPKYEYSIDAVHSSIVFKVLRGKLNYIHGRFNDVEGTITLDNRKKPKTLTIDASVPAKSVDSANKGRDKHLKQKDFLDAKRFKDISFKSTASKKLSDDRFEIEGELTFLGATQPLTVEFEVVGLEKIKGGYAVGGQTTFTIKCSEFGMPAHPNIDDEVTITVSLHGIYKLPPAG